MTKMKVMVCMKPMPKGSSTLFWMMKVTKVASIMTKVNAPVMPMAVDTFLDTPRKGQMPKNCDNTTLLTNTAAINIKIYSMVFVLEVNYFFSSG